MTEEEQIVYPPVTYDRPECNEALRVEGDD